MCYNTERVNEKCINTVTEYTYKEMSFEQLFLAM